MPESFGARLRRRREQRHIDLTAIAEQTKIKLSLLDALERDDVSQWPTGIFRRAYVRTYAHAIGLDPDDVLREFLAIHPDPADEFTALAAVTAEGEQRARTSAAPPTRLRYMVDSALGSLTRLRRNVPPDSSPARASALPSAASESSVPRIEPPSSSSNAPGPIEEALPGDVPMPADVPEPAMTLAPERSGGQVLFTQENEASETASERRAASAVDRAPADREQTDAADEPDRDQPSAGSGPTDSHASYDSTLEAVAHLCTELGRVADRRDLPELLQESARVLDATGLILWQWHEGAEELRPALVYGYSERVMAHLPAVRRDADNATAAAFRSETICEVAATAHTSGALVVPLLIPEQCAGVLAIELQAGVQPTRLTRAVAAVLAAALAQLTRSRAAERSSGDQPEPALARSRPPARPVKVRR